MLLRVALFTVLTAGLRPAVGHEPDLNAKERAAVEWCVERLREVAPKGRLRIEAVSGFFMGEISSETLAHPLADLTDSKVPEELESAWRHLCRATVLRRGPVGKLPDAARISYLLASGQERQRWTGYRRLRREKIGKPLERALVALSRHPDAELRLIAVRHATSVLAFGERSKPLLNVVCGGMTDRSPAVAAAAVSKADDTQSLDVMDRLLACTNDQRKLVKGPLLRLGLRGWEGKRVRDVALARISWLAWVEKGAAAAWCAPDPQNPGRTRPWHPRHVKLDAEGARKWWAESRDGFGFSAPRSVWESHFDDVLELEVGGSKKFRLVTGTTMEFHLDRFKETWEPDGRPATEIDAHISALYPNGEEERIADVSYPPCDDWFVASGRAGSTSQRPDGSYRSLQWTAAYLPTSKARVVRVRLQLDVERE